MALTRTTCLLALWLPEEKCLIKTAYFHTFHFLKKKKTKKKCERRGASPLHLGEVALVGVSTIVLVVPFHSCGQRIEINNAWLLRSEACGPVASRDFSIAFSELGVPPHPEILREVMGFSDKMSAPDAAG